MNNFESLIAAWLPERGSAPEFDPDFYRWMHPDLRRLNDAELALHFQNHGRTEGRIASPGSHRLGFLGQVPQVPTLEIGPAVRPTLRGEHVKYFDISNREQLIRRAMSEGYGVNNCPEIDYVSPVGDLSIIDRTFDCVFSSHCIEHQPDLMRHLRKVAELLSPQGKYCLFVPDKRFCFDALLPESTLEEVRVAHRHKRQVHTHRSVYDHYVETTHNDPVRHWNNDSEDPRRHQRVARREAADAALREAGGGYVDVHAWQFTPRSFRSIVEGLVEDGLMLAIERIYEPFRGSNEFGAILRKTEQRLSRYVSGLALT